VGGMQADMRTSVENEWLCARILHAYGLPVASCEIGRFGSQKVLMVRRFDRQLHSSRKYWLRLVQEDFCQALRIPPEFKYETEGGPSLAACFELVRSHSVSAGKDVLSLLNWVVFNVLIGNSDAHGKNLSLLLLPEGPRLSPFYDLLSTRIYTHYGLTSDLAMKIGGESNPDAVQKKNWEMFAEEIGVKPGLVLGRAKSLAEKVQGKSLQLFKGPFAPHRCDALERLMEQTGEQADKIRRRLS